VPNNTRGLAILGSTGSIGTNALEVVDHSDGAFDICGLSAGRNVERLAQQIARHQPDVVSVLEEKDVARLVSALEPYRLEKQPQIGWGEQGADAVVAHTEVSVVVTAMVGAVGLRPTLSAIRRGITVAIANKEPLVMAGELCQREAAAHGADLLPVDSEHSAIHQCLAGRGVGGVKKLLLTCSGGPFREQADLSSVSREQALKHPTWVMGPKITIDSATLMNKGLEVIEAHWLFDLPAEQIEVIIHPQSVFHSMVEFVDGSVVAQLGTPDMRIPIAYALAHPERITLPWPGIDWRTVGALTFEEPDRQRFRALDLAYSALDAGGTHPAVLNAANEVAVEAFLTERISFLQIPQLIEAALEAHSGGAAATLDAVVEADLWARQNVQTQLQRV
jgi:1-deoxy-D-xylulose-5-phosphate reductoisomerase